MSLAHGARRLPAVETAARTPLVVWFTFDGQDVDGFEGEPIAIALLAAGVRVFRTMPESGERRGGFCFTGRCADCLMVVDGQSSVRACVTPLSAGMTVQTQHAHGELSQ